MQKLKDGKIQVTSSAKDNKFVYISNMYQENNHVRRLLNERSDSGFNYGYGY